MGRSHEGFLLLVRECWNQRVEGCAMVRVSHKLKHMKQVLRRRIIETFGRVEMEIKNVE